MTDGGAGVVGWGWMDESRRKGKGEGGGCILLGWLIDRYINGCIRVYILSFLAWVIL